MIQFIDNEIIEGINDGQAENFYMVNFSKSNTIHRGSLT